MPPRVFEPSISRVGPLGMKKKTGSRRRRKKSGEAARSKSLPPTAMAESTEQPSYIGLELLESVPPKKAPEPRGRVAAEFGLEEELAVAHPKYVSSSRHALALDTRWLVTPEKRGNATASSTACYMKDLIRTLAVRGSKPCFLATTANDPREKNGVRVDAYSLGKESTLQKVVESDLLAPVLIPAKTISTESDESAAVAIPQALVAEHSWALLGEMVETVCAKDAKAGPTAAGRTPLRVTIVSTDVALFCDTDVESHMAAVDCFVEQIAPLSLDCVQIVVATTTSLGLQEVDGSQKKDGDTDEAMEQFEDGNGCSNAAVQNHEDVLYRCIDAIQTKLDEAEEAVTSRLGVGAEAGGTLNVSFAVIDGSPVGFKFLSRQWIRDTLLVNRTSGRLRFDLPETLDGTQCSVSLEIGYQIFPFAINSPLAAMLMEDLSGMAKMDVLQLVPLSSVDASLLFGVPMTVRAGLESDYAQFQEMEALVLSLFKMLQDQELAIVLRAPSNTKSNKGLFLSSNSSTEQHFVLMAQELPKSLGQPPCTGLLYRFASADQLLGEATVTTGSNLLNGNVEMESQYTEYIDAALATLTCSPFNPLLCGAMAPMSAPAPGSELSSQAGVELGMDEDPSPSSAHAEATADEANEDDDAMSTGSHHGSNPKESSVWNDASGVGACAAAMLEEGQDENFETSSFFDSKN